MIFCRCLPINSARFCLDRLANRPTKDRFQGKDQVRRIGAERAFVSEFLTYKAVLLFEGADLWQ